MGIGYWVLGIGHWASGRALTFSKFILFASFVIGLMPAMSLTAQAEEAIYTFKGSTSGSNFYYNIPEINDTNAPKVKKIEALVWVTGNPGWGLIQVV